MWGIPLAFLAGVAAGPAFGSISRALVRQTIKGGIVATRQMRRVVDEARAEVQGVVAEAQGAAAPEAPARPGGLTPAE